MKILNKYQCECCKRIWDKEEDALICEGNHKHAIKIVQEDFSPELLNWYPHQIIVDFGDQLVTYRKDE